MNPTSLVGHVLELFEQIDTDQQPPDKLTSQFFKARHYLGSRDRRFISEVLFGIIRHRRLVEALLEQYVAEHPESKDIDARHYRYLSLVVIYLTAVADQPSTPLASFWKTYFPRIDLDPFVGWIQDHRLLDYLPDDDIVRLGVKYSFQDWMVAEWIEQLADETDVLLRALNESANTTLRVNTLKTTRDRCRERLLSEGLETELTKFSPVGLIARRRFDSRSSAAFNEGWFEIQDEGSQIISLIASPKPGNMTIDGAAGAGGKSLQLAELMRNQGELIAIDVDERRLRELKTRASRAGITIIRTELNKNLQSETLVGKADVVLVDAPCSGVGTIRRNPWLKWSVTESLVGHYSKLQQEVLSFNAPFVKPGGRLMYATCSLLREENEDVLASFLRDNPDFHPEPFSGEVPQLGLPGGISSFTIFPHHYWTDGFFVAVMRRDN